MKKFYSILLAAVSLLCSSALYAINVPQEMSLQDAVNSGSEVVINLNDNVTLTSTVNIYSGQTITLNLNGKTITGSIAKLFALYHGTLDVTGAGTIENTNNTSGNAIVFQVEGHSDYTKADWSVLTIGKDVNVVASGTKGGKAIVVDGTVNGKYYTNVKATAITNIVAFDYLTNGVYAENAAATGKNKAAATGSASAMYANLGYANKFPRYAATSTSTLYAPNSVTTLDKNEYRNASTSGAGSSLAYGVKVTINGNVYGTIYGYKTNGTVGLDAEGHTDNAPEININSTATVSSANGKKSAGVASNGPSVINIDGATVKGGTGVYVKAGTVTINDAVIASTYEGTYEDPVGKTSGLDAGGSGIVVESNKTYGGGQSVTISGDTKITGSTGYGIQETITTADQSEVSKVTIEGGTIEAGDQGSIIVSQGSAEDGKIEIVGGNVNKNIYVQEGDEKVNATVDQFTPNDGNTYKTTSITDENGKTTIVVTKFEDAADVPVTANSVVAAEDETGVEWVVTADTEETLTEDKTLTYLEAASTYKQTLTVSNGATLTVGRVVLGVNAQIIVEAGAKLVVTGTQGIVAPVTGNIVLKASEDGTAQFLFNPGVKSNRHPNATVEFITKSYRVDNDNKAYQRFGVPTHKNGSLEIESDASIQTALYYYDWDVKDWINFSILNRDAVDYSKMQNPFDSYQMLTNTATVGTIYKFKGELVGNDNTDLTVQRRAWQAFANSYSANIDIETLVNNGNYGNIYVYRRTGANTYTWDPVGKADFEDDLFGSNPLATEIMPLQGFYVRSTELGNPNMVINYEGMLYNPALGITSATPRRAAAQMQDLTLARLQVMNMNEVNVDNVYLMGGNCFTSEFEDGYDAEKMINDDFNLFVTSDEKMSKLASDNVLGSYLGVSAKSEGYYTINFSNIKGEEMVLVDLVSGAKTVMTEGGSYSFYLAAGESNDYRFQVVGRANMPTDVETVENAAGNGNGVYTITGQYMGNMSIWNTLPAGVYVVDGVKRVK